ncbi:[acyl-carrier-protein] S-malonyltransferase [Austwickia chelonae]|uniref:ACP S-malonyltransferase n=1 Tax=Austwickia chelonae TaxID=100225 RepID=UPI000591617C|nr:ACP S-malonyltransferase [Austwickia chelonae]SEW06973.1 [acyl-carrier-protein] S-malonyltransferase [Austwickia chelonae]
MLAIVCPGQGSQSPGFLTPWLEIPGVAARLDRLSSEAGLDLRLHGTVSDADTIRDTAVAQPLIVAAGLLIAPMLVGEDMGSSSALPEVTDLVAGHSVGELTAAAIAGVFSSAQAMRLVRARGQAMAAAAARRKTSMSAVLGGDPEEVSTVLGRFGLAPANVNGAGQVVAAGTVEQLAGLAEHPPARSRVVPLDVAGAFHTEWMEPASAVLARAAADITPDDARITYVSNQAGQSLRDGVKILDLVVGQVVRPVRWDKVMESMLAAGVTGLVELAPAGTLTGLAKRAMRGVECVAVKTPGDLDGARALIARHQTKAMA